MFRESVRGISRDVRGEGGERRLDSEGGWYDRYVIRVSSDVVVLDSLPLSYPLPYLPSLSSPSLRPYPSPCVAKVQLNDSDRACPGT